MNSLSDPSWSCHPPVTELTAHCSTSQYHQFLLSGVLLSGNEERYRLVRVNRIRTAVVLGAVLLWAATPAMACFLPGFVPTDAERECCHHMAGHCGQSMMPASHSCCQAPAHPETVVEKGQANLPLKNVVAAVPATPHIQGPSDPATSLRSLAFFESPPDLPPFCSSSVLRI
jgi:hypothetical protein